MLLQKKGLSTWQTLIKIKFYFSIAKEVKSFECVSNRPVLLLKLRKGKYENLKEKCRSLSFKVRIIFFYLTMQSSNFDGSV